MRVAMLGQYPLDEQRILGGPEAVILHLLRNLTRFDDLEMHVVTCQPRVENRLAQTVDGLPLHILKRRRLGRITFHIRDVNSIRRTLQRLAPDVVHAHGMGIYAAAAADSPYPHAVTAHGIIFREAAFAMGLPSRFRRSMDSLYERCCLARVKNLIAISPYVEEELIGNRRFRGHVFRIENPVADAFFTVGGHDDGVTILYAGRVLPRKGLLLLLQALAKVQQRMPEARLRVAGELESAADYVKTCQQFIAQHALDTAVTFLGPLDGKQLVQEYARCAVLALPSKQETAPLVVAEAMAAARPVVATRVCGVPYVVEEGVNGLLVDYGDVDGLADALLRVLGDQSLRKRMGQRGREMAAARFRAEVVAGQTRQVYLQLVAA